MEILYSKYVLSSEITKLHQLRLGDKVIEGVVLIYTVESTDGTSISQSSDQSVHKIDDF